MLYKKKKFKKSLYRRNKKILTNLHTYIYKKILNFLHKDIASCI